MALDRKIDVVLALRPDIAMVCECAEPDRLRVRGADRWLETEPVWVGKNPNKGGAVLAFNGNAAGWPSLPSGAALYRAGPSRRADRVQPAGGVGAERERRRHAQAPARAAAPGADALPGFVGERPAVIAGDLNSNTIWDKPGWRINHSTKVKILEESFGLVSAYHAIRGEAHGKESRAHALLARPHQGRPDLSYRLCLHAVVVDR